MLLETEQFAVCDVEKSLRRQSWPRFLVQNAIGFSIKKGFIIVTQSAEASGIKTAGLAVF